MLNHEKQAVLFAEMASLSEALKASVDAANKIHGSNSNVQNVTEILSKFEGLQADTDSLIEITKKANLRATSLFSKSVAIFTISVVSALSILGLAGGVYVGYSQSESLYFHDQREININNEIAEFYSKRDAIKRLEDKGVQFYGNAIIVPDEAVLGKAKSGQSAVFISSE